LKGERDSQMKFGYEDLEVWNRAVNFAVQVIDAVENISADRKHYRLLEQIEASSTSVAMNLAEGKGRFSQKEFIQYCYIARGSLYQTITLLEIFKRKNWISEETFSSLKSEGIEIASMIKGLINAIDKSSKMKGAS
jgi:four helix bundle protein